MGGGACVGAVDRDALHGRARARGAWFRPIPLPIPLPTPRRTPRPPPHHTSPDPARPTPPQFVDTTPIDAIPGREAPLHAALSRDDSAALAAAAAARAPLTLGEQLAFPSVAAMDYMRSTGIAADGVSRGGGAAKTAPRTQPSSYHALFTTAAF